MLLSEYIEHDGLGLAKLVDSGKVSTREIVAVAIEAIEKNNTELNAVVWTAADQLHQSQLLQGQGAFAGVPMLIKDLGLQVAGWPRTSGSRFCSSVIDNSDSGLVTRYRSSGAILVGRSTTSEFGMIGTTETNAYGATRNPYNSEHIAGGSSGGSAAAVASGMVPIAHGSDGLGSIRIPASCCGLVGLKPTRDRVPNLPDGADYGLGFVADHVLTRSVRDSAAMLDITGVPEPGSPYALPNRPNSFLQIVGVIERPLRIHWSAQTRVGGPIDPEVQGALERTAELLEQLGHEVVPQALEFDENALSQARLPISAANFAATIQREIAAVGREPLPGELEALTLEALTLGRMVTGEMVMNGIDALRVLTRAIVKQFNVFDVFLCPVLTTLPPRLGTIDGVSQPSYVANALQFVNFPYALTFNFTGQPSISLPLAQSKGGLPIGMMFTARYGDEATLFRLAGQLELASPWRDRRPPIWG